MAYINERVKPEDRRTFKTGPWTTTPSRWTIDKEKGYILYYITVNRDEPSEVTYGFHYKGKTYDLDMQKASADTNFEWRFYEYPSGEAPWVYPPEMLAELREAFAAYGRSGMTPEDEKLFNRENPNGIGLFKAGF